MGRFRLGSVVPPFAALAVRFCRGRAVFLVRRRVALRAVLGSALAAAPRLLRGACGGRWVCGFRAGVPVLAALSLRPSSAAGRSCGLAVRSLPLFPSAARSRSVARRALMRSCVPPLPVRWCFPLLRSAPVAVRSPLVRWPWCGLWPLAVPVLASWCFLPRRAPLSWCLRATLRPVFAGWGRGHGPPPHSPLAWACRWWCSLAGFPGCPLGVTGCPLVLVFGRLVFGCSVSVSLLPFL